MLEQEPERLRQVVNRLADANQEALETIDRMLEHEGERGLVDVRDILDGASADVRGLLEGHE